MPPLDTLPTGAIISVAVLVVVQITLQVIALTQCLRTPDDRLALIKQRWVWVLIIVMGEMFGAILWFFAGRAPVSHDVSAPAAGAVQRDAALDLLYGKKDGERR